MDLLTDLISVISPVVAPVLGAVFSGKAGEEKEAILDREINPDMFASAVTQLNSKELKDVRRAMVREFAKVTHVNDVKLEGTHEKHFYGNIAELLQWLAWGCKVQWGKSLSALVSGLPFQSVKAPE
jgi:hypothetical protein